MRRSICAMGVVVAACSGHAASPTAPAIRATTDQPHALSAQEFADLVALAKAAAMVRFQQPSDQAATLDWDRFLPGAVERVRRARDREQLVATLRAMLRPLSVDFQIAKTETVWLHSFFIGQHLMHAWHEGLGPQPPFRSWREGRSPDLAMIEVDTVVDVPALATCKAAQLRARVRDVDVDTELGDLGAVKVYADIELAGNVTVRAERAIATQPDTGEIVLDFAMPAGAVRARVGFALVGREALTVRSLGLACDGRLVEIDPTRASWQRRGSVARYALDERDCGADRCMRLARRMLELRELTEFPVVQLGDQMFLSIAGFADTDRDAPMPVDAAAMASPSAERIASIIAAWGILSTFSPASNDQAIDWDRLLDHALRGAAMAHDARETHAVLVQLVAGIHDAQARVLHPAVPEVPDAPRAAPPRPAFGAELAPGVYYVDAAHLEDWPALVPTLAHARGAVLDLRGDTSTAIFTVLGHFLAHTIRSPEWRIPVVGAPPSSSWTWSWNLNPIAPRLPCALVILQDRRSIATAETAIQMAHEAGLAVTVGETTAGSSGATDTVKLPGGFQLRFTGVQVPLAGGGFVLGHGIAPDLARHPTSGAADEILDTGVAIARGQ